MANMGPCKGNSDAFSLRKYESELPAANYCLLASNTYKAGLFHFQMVMLERTKVARSGQF